MNLSELKWGCRRYGELGSRYDISLREFRRCVAPSLDPASSTHRACLFEWLNSWGCRLKREDLATTTSDSLVRWANVWLTRLPSADELLTDLDPAEIRRCAAAYEALRDETASYKERNGRPHAATFGKTGAAKTLFALRPMVVPPWDNPIRETLGFSGDLGSFRVYLTSVATQLRSLAAEAGVPVSALPALVGRRDSSPPKLIDEYNWVTITKKIHPTQDDGTVGR